MPGCSICLPAFQHGDASWRILPHILSMVLSYWKVGVCNRTNSETVGIASWCISRRDDRWTKHAILDQPFRVRSGWFDVICLLPAAATWSLARHFWDGQKPLRSRAEPFGQQSMDPLSMSKVTASNQQLEFDSWFLKEALMCPTKKIRGHSGLSRRPQVDAWIQDRPQPGHYKNSNHSKAYKVVSVVQHTSAKLENLTT